MSGRELAVNSGQEGSPGHGSEQASKETKQNLILRYAQYRARL
jgi:hypothetical protein